MKLTIKSIYFIILFGWVTFGFSQERISLVGKLSITNLPIHNVWGYTDSATGKKYALLCASTAGLRIVDVSDPSNPVLAASISGNGIQAIDVKTWKNYAYIVAESPSVSGKVIDLTNPAKPVRVGSFPGGHNIAITDKGYLYLAAPGLRIFDLNTNPVNPNLLFTDNSCNGHDISIVGETLFDFSDNCGTRMFNISRPDTIVPLGVVPPSGIFHHSGWPSKDGKFLYICDELASPAKSDITVWNISDMTNPFLVDSFADTDAYVHNLYVKDNYAFVSYYRAGFRVFDISGNGSIKLVAEYDTDSASSGPGYGGNFGVYIFWGTDMILASDETKGLYIFSFSNINTGLADVSNNNSNFTIYPNPLTDKMVIKFGEKQVGDLRVTISDIRGKILIDELTSVDTSNSKTYSLTNFPGGMYLISVNSGGKTTQLKFFKQ